MTTNIIEIHQVNGGSCETSYIVCDDKKEAEKIFQQQIVKCLEERALTPTEIEEALTDAEEEHWKVTSDGDEYFDWQEGEDFWITFIQGAEKIQSEGA